MESIKTKLTAVKEWSRTPRAKKIFYIAMVVLMLGWVLYRFAAIGIMNRIQVYNPSRAAMDAGVPVAVVDVKRAPGVVTEPLTIQNNRAYVSGARAALLRAGMRVGNGEIVSVSSNIDLDTGMHVVKTRGVADGLNMAEFKTTGYFIPASAVDNGAVYLMRDGVAVRTPVTVARQDLETAYVTSGLKDGDVLILSRVFDGDKVTMKK